MRFSERNRERCEALNGFNHKLDSWSLSDWMTATLGELGEAANVLKKLNRVRDGIPGNSETPDQLRAMFADELADAAIYLDLMAQCAGFDLETIREAKFAKTSAKLGYVQEKRITVNGREFYTSKETLSYEDVIMLAGYAPDRVLTVTWSRGQDGGILSPGREVRILKGEHFSVADTSNA